MLDKRAARVQRRLVIFAIFRSEPQVVREYGLCTRQFVRTQIGPNLTQQIECVLITDGVGKARGVRFGLDALAGDLPAPATNSTNSSSCRSVFAILMTSCR